MVTQVLARLTGRKIAIVSLIHHTYAPLMPQGIKGKLKAFDEGLFINSLDGIITVSEFTKRSVKNVLKKDVKFVIAPPGLNISGLGKDCTRKPENDEIRLLFVGYLDSRKGIDTLVAAYEILAKKKGMDRLVLHVVGDTHRNEVLYRKLKNNAERIGLDKRIIFHGRVSDQELENFYMSSDIFVFPSYWEGFGMVLAEAMSYGLPIVTTNAGAIPYLVKDGLNGLLVLPGDPEGLVNALETLARSPELRFRFGQANRMAASEFDWDKSFKKVTNFLDEIGQSLGGYSFL
jgi:glycosyltransferase involved in cell wall biosynthesis